MTTTLRTDVLNSSSPKPLLQSKIQVFVSVPVQGRTLAVTLKGTESKSELERKICEVAGIHERVTMTHQGASLDMKRIKQNATIVVSLGGLKGGSGKDGKAE